MARAAHDQGALQAAGTFRWRPDGTYELAATVVHRVAVPEGMPGGVAALGPEGAPDPPDVAGHGASGFTLSERPGIGVVGRLAIVRDGARAGGEGEPAASLHIIAPIPDSPDFLVLSSFTSDAARSREFFELCDAIGATLRFGG
ncbi:hypothetical protein [Streptomyces sp. NPDC048603]|uniref:hypothetical protein n=1 Tax=Streptomyces sp. NPDC048603 TaxID=3365577 RepID=UPI00371A04D0